MLLDLFDGDRAAVIDLLTVAVKTIERDLSRIEEAVRSHDARELAEASHSLKGASAGIGAERVSQLSATIERSGATFSESDSTAIADLREATQSLIADIESFSSKSMH